MNVWASIEIHTLQLHWVLMHISLVQHSEEDPGKSEKYKKCEQYEMQYKKSICTLEVLALLAIGW